MSCRRTHVLLEGACLVGGRMSCRRAHVNKCVEDEILVVTLKRHFFFSPLLMNFRLMTWSFLNC